MCLIIFLSSLYNVSISSAFLWRDKVRQNPRTTNSYNDLGLHVFTNERSVAIMKVTSRVYCRLRFSQRVRNPRS